MKTPASLHDLLTATATAAAGKPAERLRYVLGLDVDLHFAVTAIQCGHGPIRPAPKWTRPQLLKWVKDQVAAGHAVHTVQEACGFGYTLHEELVAAGAHSLLTTPTRLSPERRRKNDRLDARELCVRLARHLDGHAHELRGNAGPEFHSGDAVVVGTNPPEAPREFVTGFGLTQPGAQASFSVYVVLVTGNEKGSAPMTVTRPAA
jgi:hypothetical protein